MCRCVDVDSISLSLTFWRYSTSKFLGFDLDLWPLKVIWGPKKFIPFERPYMISYLTSMDTISLSRTVFEIFDFEVFRVWPWPSTPKGHLGSKKLYYSKSHIWLPIWLLWTPSLYLVPFSRYSTSKFLGFDLDFWLVKVIWGQKKLNHSKGHLWLPIWLLWTPSLYLVPFSRYSTSMFLGFDLDLWPQKKSSGVKNFHTIRKVIYDFLFDFYGHHLSNSYRFRDIRLRSF